MAVKRAMARFQRYNRHGTLLPNGLEVPFNPTEYTLNKGAQIAEVAIPGLDSPILQFVRGQSETLTLDLFFDSTDMAGMGPGALPVTVLTDPFYEMIKIESETHAPPILHFSWGGVYFPGRRQRYGFKCVVESVRQRYTLFSTLGEPLRATLTISLKEYKTLADQIKELNLQSSDQTKAHVVQQGDTLSRIASEEYGDPSEWRRIAEANGIENPLALPPGTILHLPPTR